MSDNASLLMKVLDEPNHFFPAGSIKIALYASTKLHEFVSSTSKLFPNPICST